MQRRGTVQYRLTVQVSILIRPEGRMQRHCLSLARMLLSRRGQRDSQDSAGRMVTRRVAAHGPIILKRLGAIGEKLPPESGADLPGRPHHRRSARSQNQWRLKVISRLLAIRFHESLARLAEPVNSEAVFLYVDLLQQPVPEPLQLHLVYHTFEDRLLNALTVRLASFCNPTQPSPSLGRVGRDIVGYQYFHDSRRSSPLLPV